MIGEQPFSSWVMVWGVTDPKTDPKSLQPHCRGTWVMAGMVAATKAYCRLHAGGCSAFGAGGAAGRYPALSSAGAPPAGRMGAVGHQGGG